MRELGTETQEAQPETEPETDAFQLMNDHELIVTNNNNNNNVETETTSDEFDLFDFNTEGFGTVVMPNGEKSVVNIADFEAALPPESGTVLMPNGGRWVVNIGLFNAARLASPRRRN